MAAMVVQENRCNNGGMPPFNWRRWAGGVGIGIPAQLHPSSLHPSSLPCPSPPQNTHLSYWNPAFLMACLTRGPVFRKGALKPAMLLSGRPQAAASALREPPTSVSSRLSARPCSCGQEGRRAGRQANRRGEIGWWMRCRRITGRGSHAMPGKLRSSCRAACCSASPGCCWSHGWPLRSPPATAP